MPAMPPSLGQTGFRFRNDDGTQASASWMAALNTNATIGLNQRFRLRITVAAVVGGDVASGIDARLQYSRNGGTYTNVALQGVASPVCFADSPNIADDELTTQQIGSGGTFRGGRCDENFVTSNGILSIQNDFVEFEFSLEFVAGQASAGDVFDFRITRGATNVLLNTYPAIPRATIALPLLKGALAATEVADAAAFTGSGVVAGTFVITEAADVAAFAGQAVVPGPVTFYGASGNAAPGGLWDVTGLNLPAGLIVVALAVQHSNSQGALNCVINGVVAKQLVAQGPTNNGGTFAGLALFAAVNPTANPSATIRCGWSNGVGGVVQRALMAHWSLVDVLEAPHDTAVPGSQSDPILLAIDVLAKGAVIAVTIDAFGTSASAVTWANAIKQFDMEVESHRFSGAHQEFAAAQANWVVSADYTGATNQPQGVAVSFAPSGPPPVDGVLAASEAADLAIFTTVAAGYTQSVQPYVGGVAVGVRQENKTAFTPVDQEFDITNARAWTPADFRDGNFAVVLGSHAPDSAFQGHWDATSVRITYVMPPLRTGTLDAVEGEDVAAFEGEAASPPVDGVLAASEAADPAAFVGALVTHGALVGIEAADVALWAGFVASDGKLAVTEAQDVAAFTGEGLDVQGVLLATEAPDAATINGTVASAGVLAATEASDSATIVGGIVATGTLAATEAPDAAAFTGGAVVGGTLAATEGSDVATFVGEGIGINGILAATEAADAAIFTGAVATVGTLAASEASDSAAFIGDVVAIRGALAAVEAPDAAAFTGGTTGTGILAATEAADVALFTASAVVTGTLDATDAPDTALAVGGVAWVAKLAAVEAPDGAAFTGTVRVAGVLAASEAPDVAAFVGGVVVTGTLAATEAPDQANFFETSIAGFFAALEAGDNAIIVATVGDYGIDIIGDEDPHPIHGGCEGVTGIIGDEDPHPIKGAATPNVITGKARTPTIKGSV